MLCLPEVARAWAEQSRWPLQPAARPPGCAPRPISTRPASVPETIRAGRVTLPATKTGRDQGAGTLPPGRHRAFIRGRRASLPHRPGARTGGSQPGRGLRTPNLGCSAYTRCPARPSSWRLYCPWPTGPARGSSCTGTAPPPGRLISRHRRHDCKRHVGNSRMPISASRDADLLNVFAGQRGAGVACSPCFSRIHNPPSGRPCGPRASAPVLGVPPQVNSSPGRPPWPGPWQKGRSLAGASGGDGSYARRFGRLRQRLGVLSGAGASVAR